MARIKEKVSENRDPRLPAAASFGMLRVERGSAMGSAKIGDIAIHYEEHGSGDPLLLIMGLAADSVAWLFQIPDFSRQFRTIAFDNRGVGRSSKPAGPYTIHQMADDAAGLLDVLKIERAHVVGVSMGGMIAQELALRHPARVRGLVLACTYPEPDADIERQRQFSLSQFGGSITAGGEMKLDLDAIDPLSFFQHLLPTVFNQEFIDRELPKLIQVFAGALQYGFSMEAILGQVSAVMSHKATDRLHHIQSPTLVITGDADRLIPPANSDILAEHIPGARLVKVPGGSHGFNFETPEVFNREVLGFLGSLAA
jgi:pimeloyl-ACP methyl ester carboxylesterase